MRVVFLSNYFNHHQKPLSDALAARCAYAFVSTAQMPPERLEMGWSGKQEPEYVCHYHADPRLAERLLRGADVVMVGSAPEKLVQGCIRRGQLVLRYTERPLKDGSQWEKYLPRLLKWHLQNPVGKPVYLLCAGSNVAQDYARFGLFRRRAFRWGYFPERTIEREHPLPRSDKRKASLLWAGRLIPWKHPELALYVAERLKAEGIPFTMELLGCGRMEEALRQQIQRAQLQDSVRLLGAMPPEQVRQHMRQAEIFLFTGDCREGWGAVLNEAMDSGCAVVASDAPGSTAYLIRNGENGCVYPHGSREELYVWVKKLLLQEELRRKLGENARLTIENRWNGEIAAERLLCLADQLLHGADGRDLYTTGPCSPADMPEEEMP